ncbi:MAG: translation initiation factor IF-2 [Nanoarchaeota archaeon]|nr:translation initiation factor IF-2 [Nanoarchaeota archaeon]
MTTRQPIVTICGHVDHGKTSILDCFRDSCVQEGEAGGITQKISFTLFPIEQMKKACPLIEKSKLNLKIPGFLFIDTPGHAAFTNLRKRGGSLADLAVLVIDINEGIKPQTAEVIQILKHNKTPFIIALNKIDNISGWRQIDSDLKKSIEMQSPNVKQIFDERYMTLIGSLNSHGFESDLYYNIEDFTKKIAMIPCSAKSKSGIPELMMMLCGLSQKYLSEKLELGKDAKGVTLEIKKEKSQNYIEAILYDGELSKKDEIAVASFSGEPIITRIRILEEIQPLCSKFSPKDKVQASTGLRIQLVEKADILPGMPFVIFKNNKKEIEEIFKKQISESIKTEKQGIIVKADSLGSLEALLVLLKQNNISVVKAGIGKISKTDLISAKANLEINELDSLILGFNVDIDEEAKEIRGKIKVITNDVVYKLIEDTVKYREEKRKEIEKKRLMELATICKLKMLPQYVFRNSNPAIFGVRIEAGKLVSGTNVINEKGEKVGRIKNIQADRKSVDQANEGMEVAISIPRKNFERQLKEIEFLYSDISASQFKTFKKNKDLLSNNEIKTLQEINQIKGLVD